jgi:hypothetical protein
VRRPALLAIAVALVTAACSSGGPGALPKVPDFPKPATTTTEVDYSAIPLKSVGGRGPTTSVVFGPGQATLSGTVVGDEGAIAGATVQVERIVSGAVGTMTVFTAEDGTWTLPMILGGRYRVRAWLAPDLAQTSSSAAFLGAAETKTMQLKVRDVGGLNVQSSIAPDPPRLGEDANLVVQVVLRVVDSQGVVRGTPQANENVELVGSSGWRVETDNPTFTDGAGRAEWRLRCRATGRQPLAVTVGTETIPLSVSNCVEPPEETTTSTAEVGLVP